MTSFSLGSRTCRGLRKVSSEISRVGSEWQNTGFVLSLSPLTRRIPTRKPNLMERFALGDRVDELYNSNTRIGNVTIFICIEASRLSYLSTPLIKLDPILPHTHFNWVLSTSSRLGRDAAVISACSIFFPLALHVLRFVAQTCFSSVLVSSRTCKAGQKVEVDLTAPLYYTSTQQFFNWWPTFAKTIYGCSVTGCGLERGSVCSFVHTKQAQKAPATTLKFYNHPLLCSP